ncbi:MAG: glycosyltransferase family 2 protein, partial [Gammaproteobacteria bacterium]|nr:glycosyltransferase family 2 protein [Gammaproteobacteria bacterium]
LHWYQIKERGSLLGLKFIIACYRILGRRPVSWLLYPIMAYFYLTSVIARQASKQYLAHLKPLLPTEKFKKLSSFKHFVSFADAILDKLAVWSGKLDLKKAKYPNLKLTQEHFSEKRGAVVLTAHLGNLEFARALSGLRPDIVVNALVFTKNSKKIGEELEKLNPEYRVNLIEVVDVNMPLAITLREKVDAGEMLVIVADRVSATNSSRVVQAEFLGAIASFPQGPFILAGLMHCKIYFMVCLKQGPDNFEIFFEEFSEGINLSQQQREQQLAFHAQKYADALARFCLKAPLQWFNFFNFWQNYEPTKQRVKKT